MRRDESVCAVEHTTVDAYREQREDTDRFRRVVMPLEKTLRTRFPNEYLEIIVPSHAVPAGRVWNELGATLADGITEAVASLPRSEAPTRVQLDRVPFPVLLTRGSPTFEPGCFVARLAPEDHRAQLIDIAAQALREKALKLAAYRRDRRVTVLLIEWLDFALLNHLVVAEAIAASCDGPNAGDIDEIYIVDGVSSESRYFPVKLGDRVFPDLPEFRHWWDVQNSMGIGERRNAAEPT